MGIGGIAQGAGGINPAILAALAQQQGQGAPGQAPVPPMAQQTGMAGLPGYAAGALQRGPMPQLQPPSLRGLPPMSGLAGLGANMLKMGYKGEHGLSDPDYTYPGREDMDRMSGGGEISDDVMSIRKRLDQLSPWNEDDIPEIQELQSELEYLQGAEPGSPEALDEEAAAIEQELDRLHQEKGMLTDLLERFKGRTKKDLRKELDNIDKQIDELYKQGMRL